jgi:hypothetical protein
MSWGLVLGLRARYAWAVLVFLCAGLGARTTQAEPADADDYERVVNDALEEYNTGHYPEARVLFEEAHALRPSARTLRGLGMTAFELKNYVRAARELTAALDEKQHPLTSEQRTEVERLLGRLRRYTGHLTLEVLSTSADVTTTLDGTAFTRELDLNLGDHELVVQAPGYQTLRRKIFIEGGQRQTLALQLSPLAIDARAAAQASPQPTAANPAAAAPASTPLHERWWFWTALGVLAAGGAVAIVALTASPSKRMLEPGDNGGVVVALERSP